MGDVMTVNGPVAPRALGPVLPHEHVIVDLTLQVPFAGLLNDRDVAVAELQSFAAQGGRTIVDCGSPAIGRDATALQDIARRSGVQIVVGSGWYREPYMDRAWVDRRSVEELAEALVHEIEHGIDDTGIRPGIIGEIGSERWITSAEERTLRAAAVAASRTGLTITTHTARWPNGLRQLSILGEHGVDPRRVIVGHCDTVADSDYHAALARAGAFVQFDTVRGTSAFETTRRVEYVLEMSRRGHLGNVLLSHDICLADHLSVRGGPGYNFVHGQFAEMLLDAGLDDEAIHLLLVDNPRRALSGA